MQSHHLWFFALTPQFAVRSSFYLPKKFPRVLKQTSFISQRLRIILVKCPLRISLDRNRPEELQIALHSTFSSDFQKNETSDLDLFDQNESQSGTRDRKHIQEKGVQEGPELWERLNEKQITKHIQSLGRSGDWRKAIGLIMNMNKTNIILWNAVLQACSINQRSIVTLELLQAMKDRGIQPDIVSYNCCIAACMRQNDSEKALNLLEEMKATGIMPDAKIYTSCMAACNRTGHNERCLALLNEAKLSGATLDTKIYAAALKACAELSLGRFSLKLLNEMYENRIIPNEVCFSLAMTACGNSGFAKMVLKLLDQIMMSDLVLDVEIYNAAMIACNKIKKYDRVIILMESLMASDIKPNVVTYHEYIQALYSQKQLKNLLHYFTTMKRVHQLTPMAATYDFAIKAAAELDSVALALEILRESEKFRKTSTEIYDACIAACNRQEKFELSCSLLKHVTNQNVEYTPDTYHEALIALCGLNELDSVEMILESSFNKGIVLLPKSYDVALRALETSKRWAKIVEYFPRLQEMTVVMDSRSTEAYMDGLVKQGEHLKVFEMFDSLQSGEKHRLTARSYNPCIEVCLKEYDFDHLMDFYNEMIQNKIEPDERTYQMCLTASIQYQKWNRIVQIYEGMRLKSLEPKSSEDCNEILKACLKVKNSQEFQNILQHMINNRIDLSEGLFEICIKASAALEQWELLSSLISKVKTRNLSSEEKLLIFCLKICAQKGLLTECIDIIRTARLRQIEITLENYNYCLYYCDIYEDAEACLRILGFMKEDGIRLNIQSYNSCIGSCAKKIQWSDVEILMNEMEQNHVELNTETYNTCMKAYLKSNRLRVFEIFREMKEKKLSPNYSTYEIMLTACEIEGDWKQSIEILQEMDAEGLYVDVASFNKAIGSCQAEGPGDNACMLLDQMKSRKVKPNYESYEKVLSTLIRCDKWTTVVETCKDMEKQNVECKDKCLEMLQVARQKLYEEECVDDVMKVIYTL